MKNNPAPVSVVIPCFQCQDTIERAVLSVANQTHSVAEVVLVDDYSEDGTLELLYAMQNCYPKGWLKIIPLTSNQGPGTARNTGWKHAIGDYIAFLDADDAWHSQKIEIQYDWMSRHPEVAMTGHSELYNQAEMLTETRIEEVTPPVIVHPKQLLLKNVFSTRSVMLKRSLNHRFKDGQYYCEDYLLWLQVCLSEQACYKFSLPLAFVFKKAYGEAGLASNLLQMEKGELQSYSDITKQGLISSQTRFVYSSLSVLKFLKRLVFVSLKLNK
ncbi:MAG: glycosyltransferase family 2 protein [Pseudomonadota bacterium]|nr:glycosyltransferase family 2 protein [Pseudomonadota bacterium]